MTPEIFEFDFVCPKNVDVSKIYISKYIQIHMASTRNRNTSGNYVAEQSINQFQREYFSYETASHYAVPNQTHFPGNGLVGMKTAHRNLSTNYSDVESYLFGIGSTNLVSPVSNPTPEINQLQSLNVMNKTPLLMPEALSIQGNQRRMFLN